MARPLRPGSGLRAPSLPVVRENQVMIITTMITTTTMILSGDEDAELRDASSMMKVMRVMETMMMMTLVKLELEELPKLF